MFNNIVIDFEESVCCDLSIPIVHIKKTSISERFYLYEENKIAFSSVFIAKDNTLLVVLNLIEI